MKKRRMRNLLAVLVVACAGSQANAQASKHDMVMLNGNIFTGVASRPYVEALAIAGDRIVATGETGTIRAMAGPATATNLRPTIRSPWARPPVTP